MQLSIIILILSCIFLSIIKIIATIQSFHSTCIEGATLRIVVCLSVMLLTPYIPKLDKVLILVRSLRVEDSDDGDGYGDSDMVT